MALKGSYGQNFKRHYTSAMASKVTDPSATRRFTNSKLFNKNISFIYHLHIVISGFLSVCLYFRS